MIANLIKTILHPYTAWYKLSDTDAWLFISIFATIIPCLCGINIFFGAQPMFLVVTLLLGYIPSLTFYYKVAAHDEILIWPQRLYVLISSGYIIGITVGWLVSLYGKVG